MIFFNKFLSNIEKFSAVGLEFFNITFEFIEKKSQYKSFTTRKQQQLGENKKIRLWSTGNSYFFHKCNRKQENILELFHILGELLGMEKIFAEKFFSKSDKKNILSFVVNSLLDNAPN